MRPSHYHYLKRMWTRQLYNRKQRKPKNKSFITAPFRFLLWIYTFPFKLILYPISLLCQKSNVTFKGCAMFFLEFIGVSFVLGLCIYVVSNFFYLFGIGPIILIFLLPIFIFARKKLNNPNCEPYNTEIEDKIIIDEKAPVDASDSTVDTIPIKNSLKQPEAKIDLNDKANYQINKPSLSKKPITAEMSTYDIERYAIMCNAHLEHQDEMAQYKEPKEEEL